MTELRFESYTMPAASMGELNPLADLKQSGDLHAELKLDESVSEDEGKYFGYGKVFGSLPYMIQDGYDRNKQPRAFNAAILENDNLRAVFLPEMGGRLWSLYNKKLDRELMYLNPVFQPANLALRNAWFSGGVEWNIGWTGHHPYTCSQLFTSEYKLSDGTPVLRMYEYERVRRAAYQIDVYLPEGSEYLFVRVQINNTQDADVPMYWWSNIAVPETEDTRTIVPADYAFGYSYGGGIKKIPVPYYEEVDASYATNMNHAYDFFFDIPKDQQKFITTVDKNGVGLVQTSTSRLYGRKQFCWGMNPGGRHWQEYLAVPNYNYLEIQCGLAPTQSHCIPMPAKAQWSWLEAYGTMQADPKQAHGDVSAWQSAYKHVDAKLKETMSSEKIEAEYQRINAEIADAKPALKVRGGGWAYLEKLRLAKEGKKFDAGMLHFDEASLTEEQQPWLELLNNGTFPDRCPKEVPLSYQIQPEWQALLEKAVQNGSDNWNAWMHLGVMRFYNRDKDGAIQAFEKSLALKPSAWVYRNLAVIAKSDNDNEKAADFYMKALALCPDQRALAIEATALLADLRPGFCYETILTMPEALQKLGRIRYHEAKAAVNSDKLAEAEEMLNGEFELTDVREGEVALTDLWFELHAKKIAKAEGVAVTDELKERVKTECPPPKHLDFRMH